MVLTEEQLAQLQAEMAQLQATNNQLVSENATLREWQRRMSIRCELLQESLDLNDAIDGEEPISGADAVDALTNHWPEMRELIYGDRTADETLSDGQKALQAVAQASRFAADCGVDA